jgi:hypothetical protein
MVLLLVWAPPALIVLCGWPSAELSPGKILQPGPVEPIAGPPPPTGMASLVVRWILVAGAASLGFALGAWLLALLFRREPPPQSPRARFLLVLFLGLASLASYVLNFLWPFPLQRYYNLKQISMGMIADRSGDVVLAAALAIVALFLLYALAHRLCQGQNDRRLWAVVLLGALLFAVVNIYVATTTTLDPYDYIARGRITGVHGGNPYVFAPKDYPEDPFLEYVSWRDATSAYGPLWETLSGILARLSGDHLLTNLLAHKWLAMGSYVLSVLLIAATLWRVAPGRALAGTLLFAWNPLILMEGLANAHNDLLMVAFLVAAIWLLSHARRLSDQDTVSDQPGRVLLYGGLATFFLAASVLVKFVPILFLPFFLLYLLAGEKRWLRWLWRGLLLLVPFVLLVVTYYLIFWKWPEIATTVARRVDMFRMSIASISREALLPRVPEPTLQVLARWPFLGLFFLSYIVLLGRAVWNLVRPEGRLAYALGLTGGVLAGLLAGLAWWQFGGWTSVLGADRARFLAGVDGLVMTAVLGALVGAGLGAAVIATTRGWEFREKHAWGGLLLACSSAFLLYLLLANFWFWPWYMIVPVALLALSGDDRLFAPLALAACAGELSHLGWNFLWYWWGITWDTVYQMDALTVFGMVVPALVAFGILGLRRRSETSLPSSSS